MEEQQKPIEFTEAGAWLGFMSYLVVVLIVLCVFLLG